MAVAAGGLLLSLALVAVHGGHGPCSLHHLARQVTLANCSHLNLTSLPDLECDVAVTSLDLSFNQLTSLSNHSTPPTCWLKRVRQLNVSHNQLHVLEGRVLALWTGLQSLDVSFNQLTHFFAPGRLTALRSLKPHHHRLDIADQATAVCEDDASFVLQRLDLSNNWISVLVNGSFVSLRQLTWLSIRSNGLVRLEAGAFTGLDNLTYLDLSRNHLKLTSAAYPPHVFAALTSLRDLHLELNDRREDGEYPSDVFGDLTTLRQLTIDTFYHTRFGSKFAALRQLETLDLGHKCKIHSLKNNSFDGFHFSALKAIRFYPCPLLSIEPCAFCQLPSLKTLSLTESRYLKSTSALRALYGLQGQNMTEINFSNIGYANLFKYTIDKRSAEYIRNLCVSKFSMKNAHLERIQAFSFGRDSLFFRCVEHIDMSKNSIFSEENVLLQVLIYSRRLRTLELQGQNTFNIEDSACVMSENCKDMYRGNFNRVDSITIPIPPTLELLNLSSLIRQFFDPLPANFSFITADRLRALDLSYVDLARCHSTLLGLEKLEVFRMNFNSCYNMSVTFFDHLPNLKSLGLVSIGVQLSFYIQHGARWFQHLERLTSLDLSFNSLLSLDRHMLRAQKDLRELRLSRNRFQTIPVELEHHESLELLDMSSNVLPTLTEEERRTLDHLARNHSVSLKLHGNPLLCTCSNLQMVQWLWHTPVSLDGEGLASARYPCITEDGTSSDTERVMGDLLAHWRPCVGPHVLSLALGLFLTQQLLLLVVYVVCRNWTHLRYAWKALRRHMLPNRLRDFAWDVYFVYADTDRDVMWACITLPALLRQHVPGLRILLRNEREVVGGNKAENIAQHIEISWKALLLVTSDLPNDEWAWFSVQQALCNVSEDTPERILVLFLDRPGAVPAMSALQTVLQVMPEQNVFHVPRATPAGHRVWETLAARIIGGEQRQ